MRESEKEIDELLVKKVDKRRERIKDISDRITHDATISLETRKLLYSLLNKGIISEFVGILSSGKEANVYYGKGQDGREIAIKIYRQIAQTSKWMIEYITGDPRFHKFRKKNIRSLIKTWAMKEYKNLKRAREAGVRVPEPLHVKNNIVIMEFIGSEGTPARRLTEVGIDDPVRQLNDVLNAIQALFVKANLIHGDLSPFNMLYHEGDVYFIDFAQGVLKDHPYAKKYFERDVDNVLGYFSPVLPEDFNRNALLNKIIQNRPIEY